MKGWSLVRKEDGGIIKIGLSGIEGYVTVFETKKGLLEMIGDGLEYDEEVRRVEVTVVEK